ncbi:type II secretion system minor pseudopilin GspH [Catenovulum sp. SM1970]|uniref:type II secretion system minor pseudopilin GspH n=1 Tax=Marinifaba aquimaris TaxID=2741323 RepID=UPI001573C598|nr:type II secretion system minor pseudopilin GspH [Marinifaba aquimaris]
MKSRFSHKQGGFTLLEIMLVLVLMAILISSISFSFDVSDPKERTYKEAKRFQTAFHMASDYGLLNNIQIGLVVDEESYQFVGYDGNQWMSFPDEPVLAAYQIPEQIIMSLTMGEIPWLDDQSLLGEEDLFSSGDEDEREEDGSKKQKLIPQVYLFSSGDITPFELTFSYAATFDSPDPIEFQVIGVDVIPLKVKDLAEAEDEG